MDIVTLTLAKKYAESLAMGGGSVLTNLDALLAALELGLVDPIAENGDALFIDNNNLIYIF